MSKALTQCENCGTSLAGDYCHTCGQKGVFLRRPVIGLAQDIVVETLSIDSRLFRTIRKLFINPGRLAREYSQGKRVPHTPPFRIYLFFSLVFFAAFFTTIGDSDVSADAEGLEISLNNGAETPDLAADDAPTSDEDERADGEEQDTDESAHRHAPNMNAIADDEDYTYDGPALLEPLVNRIVPNLRAVDEDPRLFLANVRNNLPRTLLLAPVVYTFLLFLFYFYKPGVILYDVLILSLYMHAALYLYFTISILFSVKPLSEIPVLNLGKPLILLWGVFQSYRVLHSAFGAHRWSVAVKGTLINLIYWTGIGLIIVAGMALSLLY